MFHILATSGELWTPHLFPLSKVIYPLSPQFDPQEFLMIQYPSEVYPTAKTAWFARILFEEQPPLKTPEP